MAKDLVESTVFFVPDLNLTLSQRDQEIERARAKSHAARTAHPKNRKKRAAADPDGEGKDASAKGYSLDQMKSVILPQRKGPAFTPTIKRRSKSSSTDPFNAACVPICDTVLRVFQFFTTTYYPSILTFENGFTPSFELAGDSGASQIVNSCIHG